MHIEDTERLVTEIEMLKVVLFLVCRIEVEASYKGGHSKKRNKKEK
jgi:hypothetical protein